MNVQTCRKCGAVLPPEARFCEECGTPVGAAAAPYDAPLGQMSPGRCPTCGTPYLSGQAFCEECGTPLGASSTPGASSAPGGAVGANRQVCSHCGSIVEPGAAFCQECGNPVGQNTGFVAPTNGGAAAAGFCENCGKALVAGAVFCENCGAPVGGAAPVSPVTPVNQGAKKQGFFRRFFTRKQTAAPAVATPPAAPASDTVYCANCGAACKVWQQACPLCNFPLGDAGTGGSAGSNQSGSTGGSGSFANRNASPKHWASQPQDDAPTEVYEQGGAGYDDYPTMVVDPELVVYVVRSSTGERMDMTLPAVLGKGSAATCLVAGNAAISRTHARISGDAHGYLLEDLGATNGTTVNGVRLERNGSAVLRDGSSFELANEEFIFHTA